MRRKLISILLTVCMVVGCFAGIPVSAGGPSATELELNKTVNFTVTEDEWNKAYSFTPEETGKYAIACTSGISLGFNGTFKSYPDTEYAGMRYVWIWIKAGSEVEVDVFCATLNEDYEWEYPESVSGQLKVVKATSDFENGHFAVNGESLATYCDSYYVEQGDAVTIKAICDVTTSGSVKYQWYVRRCSDLEEDEYVDEYQAVSGATGSTYRINSFSSSADYACKVYTSANSYEFCWMELSVIIDSFFINNDQSWDNAGMVTTVYGGTARVVYETESYTETPNTLHYTWKNADTGSVVKTGTVNAGEPIIYTNNNVTGRVNYLLYVYDDYGNLCYRTGYVDVINNLTSPDGYYYVVGSQGRTYNLSVAFEHPMDGGEYRWYKKSSYYDMEELPEFEGMTSITTDVIDSDYVNSFEWPEWDKYCLYQCEYSIPDGKTYEVSFYFVPEDDFVAVPHGGEDDINVNYGSSASMKVDVYGGSNVTYQWYVVKESSDDEEPTYTAISGATGATLTRSSSQIVSDFNSASQSFSRYQCRVKSGSVTKNANFTVEFNETYHLRDYHDEYYIDVELGEPVTLNILDYIVMESGYSSSNINCVWYYGNKQSTGKTFTLPSVIEDKYVSCLISNGINRMNCWFELYIYNDDDDYSPDAPFRIYDVTCINHRDDSWDADYIDYPVEGQNIGLQFSVNKDNIYYNASVYDEDDNLIVSKRFYGGEDKIIDLPDPVSESHVYTLVVTDENGNSDSKSISVRMREEGESEYDIYRDGDENSWIEFEDRYGTCALEGDQIVFSVATNSGYRITNVYVMDDDGTEYELTSLGQHVYSFTMPAQDVTIYSTSEEIPASGPFPVRVIESVYGTTTVSHDEATSGTKVTVYPEPREGYLVDHILVVAENGNSITVDSSNRFTMTNSAVAVKVVYKRDESVVKTGWVKEDGVWHYYDEEGVKQSGWINIDGIYYYLDPANNDGMATGWLEIGNKWYHFKNDGAMTKGWYSAGSSWWYFDGSGAMVTSWKKIDNKWYFFDRSSGVMMTGGWKKIDDVWYYFRESGNIATGWEQINGKYYYFNNNGEMQTGWIKDNNKWYYMNPQGDMKQNSWLNDGGKWYYFVESGAMAAGTSLTINGVVYRFAANGVCENPNGDPQNGWVKIDGVYYYYNGGEAVTGWQKIAKKWYYLDPDNGGAMWIGWLEDGGYTYYMDNSGAMVANRTITIDGTEYTFDASGHLK